MNKALLMSGTTLLGIGLVCLAALPFAEASWANTVQTAIVFSFMAVGVVVLGFVAYPLAKAEADCKRKECEDKGEATPEQQRW